MSFGSKKISLIVLGITAFVGSRAMFAFFNDPEGPNLLIVMVLAVFVYFLSLSVYASGSSAYSFKRFWLAIVVQIVFVTCLYFLGVWF